MCIRKRRWVAAAHKPDGLHNSSKQSAYIGGDRRSGPCGEYRLPEPAASKPGVVLSAPSAFFKECPDHLTAFLGRNAEGKTYPSANPRLTPSACQQKKSGFFPLLMVAETWPAQPASNRESEGRSLPISLIFLLWVGWVRQQKGKSG